MGLSVSIDLFNTGVPATYWEITSIIYDKTNGLTCQLAGYLSGVTAGNGSRPLSSTSLHWPAAALSDVATLGNVLKDVYALVKADPRFSSATDDGQP